MPLGAVLARWTSTLVLAGAALPAWGLLIASDGIDAVPPLCSSGLLWSVPTPSNFAYFFVFVTPESLALGWGLMVTAMMLPTLGGTLRQVTAQSFSELHSSLMGLVIIAFSSTWLFSGFVFITLALALRLSVSGPLPLFVALALAVLWQVSPWKQVALNRCHFQKALPAFAPAAYLAALFLGGRQAFWCILACWPLMLTGLLVPSHHTLVMVLVALFIWAERLDSPRLVSWGLHLPYRVPRLALLASLSCFQHFIWDVLKKS